MKVIDARSGKEMKIGDRVSYPGGESVRLVDVDPGLFSASAVVETTVQMANGALRTMVAQVPLTVCWLHPGFLFQHVAFIPS